MAYARAVPQPAEDPTRVVTAATAGRLVPEPQAASTQAAATARAATVARKDVPEGLGTFVGRRPVPAGSAALGPVRGKTSQVTGKGKPNPFFFGRAAPDRGSSVGCGP